jgi:hypothetical protein
MGVKWLTTYVQEVERILSSQITFPVEEAGSTSSQPRPTFVVDAWAFIYHVYLSQHGDSIRELDHQAFQASLQRIIGAWQSAGIAVVLVFDGPALPSKLPTIVSRRAGRAASNSAYMKSSPASRTSIRFQRDCGVVPPNLLYATIDACQTMPGKQVEMVFAPTEADSLVAEIATERDNGYAVSLDSDYFILCARGKCCPYVPLDTIEYIVQLPTHPETANVSSLPQEDADEMGDFVPVKGRKRGAKKNNKQQVDILSTATQQRRDIPPGDSDEEKLSAVSIRAHRPQDLALHLQIQPTLLPLLAALVGNDYTTAVQSNVLFRQLQGPRRVSEAASILRSEWLKVTKDGKSAAGSRKARLPLKSSWNEDDFNDAKSDTFSSASSAMATPTRHAPEPIRPSAVLNGQDPVRAMIGAIVEKAIAQMDASFASPRYIPNGEKELIVESVIDSVATYSLLTHSDAPHLASPSALFFGQPSSLMSTSTTDTIASPEAVERWRQAYAQGHFTYTLIEALTNRVFTTTVFAEDADVKSVQVLEAKELRCWLWSILFEAWGMDWARKEWDEGEGVPVEEEKEEVIMAAQLSLLDKGYKEGERPDDIISVDTESSHSVTLEEEDGGLDELPTRPGSVAELRKAVDKPAPGVTEYVRRAHHYTGELVQIHSLQKLLKGALRERDEAELPPSLFQLRDQSEESSTEKHPTTAVLMPLNIRLDLYLHSHRSCTAEIQALDRSWWPIAAILRLAIQSQAQQLGPTKRKLNWSRDELMAALESASYPKRKAQERKIVPEDVLREVLPSTRAIHLSSTLQLLLETSHLLAQSLLLPVDVSNWPQPHSLYHGPTFHYKINEASKEESRSPSTSSKEFNTVFKAIVSGLEDDLGIDVSELRKERKAKKKEAKEKVKVETATVNGHKNSHARQIAARNAFALLGEDAN